MKDYKGSSDSTKSDICDRGVSFNGDFLLRWMFRGDGGSQTDLWDITVSRGWFTSKILYNIYGGCFGNDH